MTHVFFWEQQPRHSCLLKREQQNVKRFLFNRGNIWNNHAFFREEQPKHSWLLREQQIVKPYFFSGSNSLDNHAKTFSICGAMNNMIILVIPFTGDVR
jgi:hypothetical protein